MNLKMDAYSLISTKKNRLLSMAPSTYKEGSQQARVAYSSLAASSHHTLSWNLVAGLRVISRLSS